MKRYALLAFAALAVGCNSNSSTSSTPASSPMTPAATQPTAMETPAAPTTPAAPATPAAPMAPATQPAAGAAMAAPAAPAALPTPFDMEKDDKIYIFASLDDMIAFGNGKAQAFTLEKPNYTADGKTVVAEAVDEATAKQLLAGYAKQHPDVKK